LAQKLKIPCYSLLFLPKMAKTPENDTFSGAAMKITC
jgi:hypothetical protein